MQSQFPSVSTQDKTPKNINNVEENHSVCYQPRDKTQEDFKTSSMNNIDINLKARPTNIKQIKEELLNQGRKDKEGSLREDRSRRDLTASRKYLGVDDNSAIGTASQVTKPRSITDMQPSNLATSSVTAITSLKTNQPGSLTNITDTAVSSSPVIPPSVNATQANVISTQANVISTKTYQTNSTGGSSSYWID